MDLEAPIPCRRGIVGVGHGEEPRLHVRVLIADELEVRLGFGQGGAIIRIGRFGGGELLFLRLPFIGHGSDNRAHSLCARRVTDPETQEAEQSRRAGTDSTQLSHVVSLSLTEVR